MASRAASSKQLQESETRSEAAGTMSFIFHLTSVLPEPVDSLLLHLYGKLKPSLNAVVPHNLGRISRLDSHQKEYLSLFTPPVPVRSRNLLPNIRRSLNLSHVQLDRYNHYRRHRLTYHSPGVVRVVYKPGRASSMARYSQPPSALASAKAAPVRASFDKKFHSFTVPETKEAKPEPAAPSPPLVKKRQVSEVVVQYEGGTTAGVRNGYGTAVFSNSDTYAGEWSEGKRHGTGTQVYKRQGMTYKGEWVFDKRNGHGSLLFPNGDKVVGTWEDNRLKENRVKVVYAQGQTYEGEMKDLVRQGIGTLAYLGGLYTGPWVTDMREGIGVLENDQFYFEGLFKGDTTAGVGALVYKSAINDISVPGSVPNEAPADITIQELVQEVCQLEHFIQYQFTCHDIVYVALSTQELQARAQPPSPIPSGSFQAGKLNGAGLAIYGSFGVYLGNFHEGRRSGWGQMKYTDPNYICLWSHECEGEYIGQWCNDQRQGYGVMTWPNNMRYEGHFKKDQRDQVCGTMWFMTGEVYDGGWVDNLMQGQGTLTSATGSRFTGQFAKGRALEEGTLDIPDGRKYQGSVSMFEPHGKGEMLLPDGAVYRGEFKRGKFSGEGSFAYANGDKYTGQWDAGRRQGHGVFICKDTVYEGQWKTDKKEGEGVLRKKTGEILFEGDWANDLRVD